MTHEPLHDVTKLLQGAVDDAEDVHAMPPGREHAIAELASALRKRARTRRRRVVGVSVGLAVAACVGAVIATSMVRSGRVELGRVHGPGAALTAFRDGHAATLGDDAVVAEGTDLRTPPRAEVRLDFTSGTQVTLGGDSRLRLVEQTRKKRFALESGSFFAKVAKLSADERFVVTTSDAEIEVHGTAFRVTVVAADPACGDGTTTRLDVSEGVVAIRHNGEERLVAAGEQWPKCPVAAVAPPATTVVQAPSVDTTPIPSPRAPATVAMTPPPPSASVARSRLGEQNDLYNDAMRDKNEARPGAAIAKLDRFLASYPQSALAESATVERMRLLASGNRARGEEAARDYLRRYPHGFAAAEATTIAGTTP